MRRIENQMNQLSEKIRIVLICVVSIITFFVNNHVIEPDIMESRNIITAREMVYDGNWLIPTMNADLRLEKPPLPTWLTALAELISPDSIILQRAMAGLAALLLIFYFWRFAKKVLNTDPFVPSLLLCTCYNVILMGRTASWDIYCHAFMMGGIYHLARALILPAVSWRHFLAAGVFTGLSIMSKGPVSLYGLFLPFVLSFAYVYRPSAKGKGGAIAAMSVLALVIGAWWYVYVHVAEADALAAVVAKESGAWVNHNVRPWWYYWKFFLETGIWSVLLLTAMFLPLADKERRVSCEWLFSMAWMLGSLVLLSLMPEKKSRYLLPLLIPASYVMACLINWWVVAFRNRESASVADKYCFRGNTILVALAVVALPVAAWLFVVRPGFISVGAWVAFTIFTVALAVYLIFVAVRLRPLRLVGGVTVLFVFAECFVLPNLSNVINNPAMKSVSHTREIKELDGLPFYHVDSVFLRIELVYAAHRPIRPINPDSLSQHLPCVLLTHQPISEALNENSLKNIETKTIGRYDDNHRPKSNKRYSNNFIYYVTLLKAKQNTQQQQTNNVSK